MLFRSAVDKRWCCECSTCFLHYSSPHFYQKTFSECVQNHRLWGAKDFKNLFFSIWYVFDQKWLTTPSSSVRGGSASVAEPPGDAGRHSPTVAKPPGDAGRHSPSVAKPPGDAGRHSVILAEHPRNPASPHRTSTPVMDNPCDGSSL